MGDDGLRARHDAPQHGDFALVHRHSGPIGDHMPIDIGDLPRCCRQQRGHQSLSSLDPFQVAQKLAERCALIASPLECHQGMLFDIELRELLDPKQGRIEKRLKTQQERLLFMM